MVDELDIRGLRRLLIKNDYSDKQMEIMERLDEFTMRVDDKLIFVKKQRGHWNVDEIVYPLT